jgi:hypothetical protein
MSTVSVVNMIPFVQSGEAHQDSEPNIAVNPANPAEIVGSAFTLDPNNAPLAPLFMSLDGGNNWFLNSIMPGQVGGQVPTNDTTVRFADSGVLYAAILRLPGSFRLNILSTATPFLPFSMAVHVDNPNDTDQPYIQAFTDSGSGADHVCVPSNSRQPGPNALVDFTLDGTASPPPFARTFLDPRSGVFDLAAVRSALHTDGTVYAAFYHASANTPPLVTADVVVVRDDNGGQGAFEDLVDPSDNLAGVPVETGITVPILDAQVANFGQERLTGSNLSIAVDPNDSSRVYVAFAEGTNGQDYRLHVRTSNDAGDSWSGDIRIVDRATNPALAINDAGTVGFLFQALSTGFFGLRWETHFEMTDDDFGSTEDAFLADVPANEPPLQFQPYIGDYVHVLSVGSDFYGVFSASNIPDNNNFPMGVTYQRNADFSSHTLSNLFGNPVSPSIDPFFFHVTP